MRQSVLDCAPLRPLVDLYGWQRVWDVGIQILGHPPTWDINPYQIFQIEQLLISHVESD